MKTLSPEQKLTPYQNKQRRAEDKDTQIYNKMLKKDLIETAKQAGFEEFRRKIVIHIAASMDLEGHRRIAYIVKHVSELQLKN